MSKTAVVFGSTGLIGSFLLKQLLADERYAEVKILVRKPTGIRHAKLDEVVTNFKNLDDLRQEVKGDEVFCCLGTTIKTAGSEAAFRRIDFELVRWAAMSARENKVNAFLVVSSIGANAKSRNFYLRTKGEMELAVTAAGFEKCVVVRPSMLLGPRTEKRFGESMGKAIMNAFSFAIPKHWKAVEAEDVAASMIEAANSQNENGVIENERLLKRLQS
ncbi:MAG: NAD(P)H-binding protein [Bacteroidia bacterium]|jgi:uncharacterized protein YbjT (DUF2867 family)|nr:NAD(P)H-binding protein [Bacteroidia bacterium]